MRYAGTVTLAPVADNSLRIHVFRGNGAYDPDYTATGGSCRAFNTMAAMYDTYRVRGSRCTVKPVAGGAGYGSTVAGMGVNSMGIFTLAASTDATGFSGMTEDNIDEQTSIITKNLGHIYSTNQQSITAYKSTKRMYPGVDSRDGIFSANVATVPTQEWYWIVGYLTNGGTTASGTAFLPVRVVIDYWIEFTDPKEIVS